jgi:hypothetical protein
MERGLALMRETVEAAGLLNEKRETRRILDERNVKGKTLIH